MEVMVFIPYELMLIFYCQSYCHLLYLNLSLLFMSIIHQSLCVHISYLKSRIYE